MSAIGFAIASLVFGAAIEVSYKRYSMRARSRGLYLAGIGLVWGVLQYTVASAQGAGVTLTAAGLGFGLAAGVAVAASNLLLIESLTRIDVSLGSTIYRLNTVAVVVGAYLFLGETIGPVKLAAIAFGVAAAVTLYGGTRGVGEAALVRAFFWLAVLASLLRATFGVITKAALGHGVEIPVVLLASAACWVVGGLGYAILREGRPRLTRDIAGYALVSGIFAFLIVNTLALGLELGDASTVIPIANLSFVVVLAVSMLLRMERMTPRKATAVALAAGCIWLMSRTA